MRAEPAYTLRLRPATEADSDFLFDLRNDADVRAASRNTGPLDPAVHERWLAETLASTDRFLSIVELDREPIGTVRFDVTRAEAEISVAVTPEARGGIGAPVISLGAETFLSQHADVSRIVAEVRHENRRSLGAFARAGFRRIDETRTPGFAVLVRDRDD